MTMKPFQTPNKVKITRVEESRTTTFGMRMAGHAVMVHRHKDTIDLRRHHRRDKAVIDQHPCRLRMVKGRV